MPLTRVIDHRKERENINKSCGLKVHYRKWVSLRTQHLSAWPVLLCFSLVTQNEGASWDKATWKEVALPPLPVE
jgi:hypothetical protein